MSCPAVVATVLTSVPRRVSVEFVADVVCPWCYIGMRRLEQAGQQAGQRGIQVDVSYTPFILRRHLPKSGVDKIEMFAQGGMGAGSARAKFEHIRQTAVADGLCLDFESQRAGNSEDAHRLLLWAATEHGAQWLPLMGRMFEQYNCRRGWLGSPEVLEQAVEATTLPVKEAARIVADEAAFLDELEGARANQSQTASARNPARAAGATLRLNPACPVRTRCSRPDNRVARSWSQPLRAPWHSRRASHSGRRCHRLPGRGRGVRPAERDRGRRRRAEAAVRVVR